MNDRSKTVSFRLPQAFLSQLIKDAEQRNLDSHHEFARQIVINYLTDASGEEGRQDVLDIKQSLETLREDLATSTAAILAFGGKWTPEQAKAWAKQTLLGEER